jgi:hypothetical protein
MRLCASSAVGLLLLLKDGDERPIGIMSNPCRRRAVTNSVVVDDLSASCLTHAGVAQSRLASTSFIDNCFETFLLLLLSPPSSSSLLLFLLPMLEVNLEEKVPHGV